MAESVVSSTVTTLGNLLNEEANFLLGVEDKVELLKEELSCLQPFLKDADAKQHEDETVRNWVAHVIEAAYDAEDIIETFALKIASRRRGGIVNVLKRSTTIFNQGRKLHQAGLQIEAIRTNLADLNRRKETFGLEEMREGEGEGESSISSNYRRRTFPNDVEQIVVGLEESIMTLVHNLVDGDKHTRVFSICGMGGLGKTTLAKQIYNHVAVRHGFEHFAWANVSQECKTREVWQTILFNLTSLSDELKNGIKILTEDELAQKLFQILQEKKCLVILDDIWSTQAWDSLSLAFPKEETSSKILLTTRNREVAMLADPRPFHYELNCLSKEESWELFQKIAIGRKGADFTVDATMGALAKDMLNYCAGLPLAIVVLGGMLATKYSSNDWQLVLENLKSNLRSGRGYGLGVVDVLSLSYRDLPTKLRPCFLYFSLFPEDFKINVDKLIRMWVAEGFITLVQHGREGKEEESIEDVAESYLNELINRCMVLVGERDQSLRIKTCRLHPLMRDLCLSEAYHESFHNIINYEHGDENPSSSTTRRLAVHLHGRSCQFPLDYITSPRLRSLLCFYDFSHERWILQKPDFNNFKLLRVLDLEGADIEGNLLKDVGELIYLRSLSLRHARVSKIPSSIGNLRYLQTLDLLIGGTVMHVPNVIWKMEHLRHLYLPEFCDAKTKLRLDTLKNLRILVNFPAQNCDVKDLFTMTNLRELTIREPISIKNFMKFSKSETIKHLRVLSLDNIYEEEDDGEATKSKDFRSMSLGDYTVPSI